jgi:hypothetical protein
LTEALDFHIFLTEAADVDAWMMDILRLVSSEDVGKDEANVQTLLKKHEDVADKIKDFQSTIEALQQQKQVKGFFHATSKFGRTTRIWCRTTKIEALRYLSYEVVLFLSSDKIRVAQHKIRVKCKHPIELN